APEWSSGTTSVEQVKPGASGQGWAPSSRGPPAPDAGAAASASTSASHVSRRLIGVFVSRSRTRSARPGGRASVQATDRGSDVTTDPAVAAAPETARVDFMPLDGWDYVELWVGNAKQAAYFYEHALGFGRRAYAGPETGVRDRASYVLEQGSIRLV